MAITVTAAQTGPGVFEGLALTVKVLTGQAASPIGSTAGSGTVTVPELAITPAATGSWVYGAAYYGDSSGTYTPAATTTFSANISDTVNGARYGTFRSTGTTTSGTPVTLGASAPTGTADDIAVALAEIKAGTGLAEDASSPASVSTTTATTITTAAFTPPAGSLLVAMVSSNASGDGTNSQALSVTDSSGLLTWTQQAAGICPVGSATYVDAAVWTAPVPATPPAGTIQPRATVPAPRRRPARAIWRAITGQGPARILAPAWQPKPAPRRVPARAVIRFTPVAGVNAVPAVPPSGTVQPRATVPPARRRPGRAVWQGPPLVAVNGAAAGRSDTVRYPYHHRGNHHR